MEVFTLVPGGDRQRWILTVLSIIPILLGLWLLWSSLKKTQFELGPEGLNIGGEYGRFVPRKKIRIAESRIVNLETDKQFAPTLRTFGTGLPGYNAGWFRLANGEKALCYLTDKKYVVYMPTTDGYSILLSVANSDGFLQKLKNQ